MKKVTITKQNGDKVIYDDIVCSYTTHIGYHLEHKDGSIRYVHPMMVETILIEGKDEE